MSLDEYKKKRDFGKTPEPAPKIVPRKDDGLIFVVQKHAARRLHYDFRLELAGVLLSWAVPKGPSLVPGEKRLAARTEDHPLDYADFEGVIPAGEYGGGSVIVWDRGTWTPIGDPHEGISKGHLEFRLEGEKLRGRWHLIQLKKDLKSWLLVKGKDEEARKGGPSIVDERPESVISGKDIREVARAPKRVWRSNRAHKAVVDPGTLTGARKAPLPKVPAAQLATLVAAAPEGPEWIHEIKLDGYRILARIEHGQVQLWTRNGNDWSDRFAGLLPALAALPCDTAVLDGEAVVLGSEGRSSFQMLQNAMRDPQAEVHDYVFDLIYLDGYDLGGVPLIERKGALRRLLGKGTSLVRYNDHVEGEGAEFFAKACQLGVEGIVSKQRDAPYEPRRTRTWLKVKCQKRQELVIVGYTEPKGSRKGLGALLLGVHDDEGKLVFAGKVGTGFSAQTLATLRQRLEKLARKEPTVVVPASVRREAHWVIPTLAAEVSFTEWTADGHVRHPVFQGLREDKPAAQIVQEGTRVKLTHPDRVLYPETGITKRELAGFYEAVAELILPGLRNRPLTLVRCPQGRTGHCFYQKHAGETIPATVPRVGIKEDEEPYLYVDALPALLTLVQFGVVELHVWGSTIQHLDRPDVLVFDLDPDPTVSWPKVMETARRLAERLEELGLKSFPRVTGGKGLHLVVPIQPKTKWAEVRAFTELVARSLVRDHPDELTAIMSKAKRKGKIFIDYLRNAADATAIASYSTRRHEGAPVAMPLRWDQLDPKAKAPPRFELRKALAWAAKEPDPWPDFEEARRAITAAMVLKLD